MLNGVYLYLNASSFQTSKTSSTREMVHAALQPPNIMFSSATNKIRLLWVWLLYSGAYHTISVVNPQEWIEYDVICAWLLLLATEIGNKHTSNLATRKIQNPMKSLLVLSHEQKHNRFNPAQMHRGDEAERRKGCSRWQQRRRRPMGGTQQAHGATSPWAPHPSRTTPRPALAQGRRRHP